MFLPARGVDMATTMFIYSDSVPPVQRARMGEDAGERDLLELLAAERTMQILSETDGKPRSVEELTDVCEASGPTLYRHVNAMLEHDLLQEETELDAGGNHYTVYRNNVRDVVIKLDPAAADVVVDLTYRDAADQFEQLWEDMKYD